MLVVAYSWWATGTRPFTLAATVRGGGSGRVRRGADPAPSVVTGPAGVDGRARWGWGPEPRWPAPRRPWIVILVLSVSLEAAALALGGRSSGVPTLSTVVDHALGRHPVRLLLFCGWLAAGLVPAVRSRAVRALRAPPTEPGDGSLKCR